jgi:glycosyltransferase involved in cell wall biosynthesis
MSIQKMNFTLLTSAKFFMFDLAEALHATGNLEKIITGYPRIRLKLENLPKNKIKSYPLYQSILQGLARNNLERSWLHSMINNRNLQYLDKKTAGQIGSSNLISMSSLAVETARIVKERGNKFILNRSSQHIIMQKNILEQQIKIWDWPEQLPLRKSIERELEEYQLADKIIVPSHSTYESFEGQGLNMEKIIVNPFPLSFTPKLESNDTRKNLLFVGNVTLRKGFPTLIEALNLLDFSNLKLHVAGVYSEKFISHLKKKSLSFENVEFHGPLSSEKLTELYESCDVFVLPSVEDGWGMVVNEAMVHGCIPIVSNGAGASEQIVNGVNGYVFEAGNSTELAECITNSINNKELRANMIAHNSLSPYFKRTWKTFSKVYIDET